MNTVLSSREITRAGDYLTSTRDELLQAVSDLPDGQWHFQPGPDRWSIAEVLEHLVLIEERVHGRISEMASAPAAEQDRVDSQVDDMIMAEVPNRSTRVQAPPFVLPTHHWNPAEMQARFAASRNRTLALLTEAECLRGHVLPHPIFGPWDGYQWILAVAAHSARHTDQIREVKACPGFPECRAELAVPVH